MGAGTSQMGVPPTPSHPPRSRPRPRRRSSITRTISSLFVCGASTQMEDYQAELLVDSAEIDNQGKLESTRKQSDVVNTKTSNNGSASASYANRPSSTEIVILDADDGMSGSTSVGSSQVNEPPSNSNALHSHGLEGSSSSSEVSPENIVSEAIDPSSESSSTSSDSPRGFDCLRDDNVQEAGTSSFEIQELERLQNSSESRWSGIRLLRDPSSRRNHWRIEGSRSFNILAHNSDDLGPGDNQNHDLNDDISNDEHQGEVRSRQSRIQGSNEQRENQESEIWGVVGGSLDSTDHQTAVCPRGIHADGSCSCQSDLAAEELAAQAGISRVVLLAEALLEVLDQIYRQPMMISLPTVSSIPAPESVVDNFPVKIYNKANHSLECADDVSQCYVCLDEYEEGDKIRVLPCNHEYHMLCVDRWLKEVHGVCPLCRGDVCEGLTSACDSDNDDDEVSS